MEDDNHHGEDNIEILVGSNVGKSTLPSLPPCYLCGETAGDQHRNDDAENIEFMIFRQELRKVAQPTLHVVVVGESPTTTNWRA